MRLFPFLLLISSLSVFAADSNERLDLATKGYSQAAAGYRQGRVALETVATWSTRLYELQKQAGVATARADFLYRMKDLESVAANRVKSGQAPQLEQLEAQFRRLEAELTK